MHHARAACKRSSRHEPQPQVHVCMGASYMPHLPAHAFPHPKAHAKPAPTTRRHEPCSPLYSLQAAVEDFSRRPDVCVMLVSLKAASLGVNLVSATQVVLLVGPSSVGRGPS